MYNSSWTPKRDLRISNLWILPEKDISPIFSNSGRWMNFPGTVTCHGHCDKVWKAPDEWWLSIFFFFFFLRDFIFKLPILQLNNVILSAFSADALIEGEWRRTVFSGQKKDICLENIFLSTVENPSECTIWIRE